MKKLNILHTESFLRNIHLSFSPVSVMLLCICLLLLFIVYTVSQTCLTEFDQGITECSLGEDVFFPWVLCLFSFLSFLGFIYTLAKNTLSKIQMLTIIVMSFAIASGYWYVETIKYYDDAAHTRWTESTIVRGITTYALKNGGTKSNFNELFQILKETTALVRVTDSDGKILFEKKNLRSSYTPEVIDNAPIMINGKTYSYLYQYNNRPNMWVAYCRGVSLSLLYSEKNDLNWHRFITLRLYNRSTSFIGVLIVTLLLFPFTLAWYNYRKRVDEQNKSLDNFRNAYEKLCNDFSIGASNSGNNLQYMQTELDMLVGSNSLEESLKESSGVGRHDILNRIKSLRNNFNVLFTDQDQEKVERIQSYLANYNKQYRTTLIQDLYDVILSPWIGKIHDELKSLDSTLEVQLQELNGEEIVSLVRDAIPQNIQQGRISDLTFTFVSDSFSSDTYATLIPSKLRSIVFNIVQNSLQQMERYMDELDDEEFDAYVRKLSVSVKNINHSIVISIKDNGGGFPKDIVDKIYKEKIPTSKKDGRRFGQGTSYIQFFISFMKGVAINASNIKWENNERGACTVLSIPCYKKE